MSGSPSAFRAGAAATGRLWLFRGDADLVGVGRTARHVEGQDAIGVGGPPRRGGIRERLGVGRHGGEDLPRAARLALDLEAVFIAGVVFPGQTDSAASAQSRGREAGRRFGQGHRRSGHGGRGRVSGAAAGVVGAHAIEIGVARLHREVGIAHVGGADGVGQKVGHPVGRALDGKAQLVVGLILPAQVHVGAGSRDRPQSRGRGGRIRFR